MGVDPDIWAPSNYSPRKRSPKRRRDLNFHLFHFRRNCAGVRIVVEVGVEYTDEVGIDFFLNTEKRYKIG